MKVDKKLLDLTNKFLEEFMILASKEDKKRDDLFHFNFTLPEVIGKSNYPKYEEQVGCLMGMSSFDDAIAKVFFNQRIQGFIKNIEDRLEVTEQEDYLVENIVKNKYQKEVSDFKWGWEDGKMVDFKTEKKNIDAEKITFDVSNSRNEFRGKVIIEKELKKIFTSENDFIEEMTTDEVIFFNKSGEKIMTITNKYNKDLTGFFEEGTFSHYKHIADINSFFLILSM